MPCPSDRSPLHLEHLTNPHHFPKHQNQNMPNNTSPITDGRRKKRPGIEEQTDRITKAAIALFIENGVKATSIAQICTQADVSKPTYYRCFKDKDELLQRLYQFSINNHVETLIAATKPNPNSDGREAITEALDQLFDAIFQQPDLALLLFREYSDPSSPANSIIDSTFEKIANSLHDYYRNANQTSNKQIPSKTFLKAVMAAFQWIVYDAIKSGLTPQQIRDAKQAGHELAAAMFSQVG